MQDVQGLGCGIQCQSALPVLAHDAWCLVQCWSLVSSAQCLYQCQYDMLHCSQSAVLTVPCQCWLPATQCHYAVHSARHSAHSTGYC